jgi:hypothetical protein
LEIIEGRKCEIYLEVGAKFRGDYRRNDIIDKKSGINLIVDTIIKIIMGRVYIIL